MSSSAVGVALNNKANEIATLDQPGTFLAEICNKGLGAIALSLKKADGSLVTLPGDTKHVDEPVQNGDSITNLPIKPGSFVLAVSGVADVVDRYVDGRLYLDRVTDSILSYGAVGVTSGKLLTSAGEDFAADGVVPGDELIVRKGDYTDSFTVVTVGTTTVIVDRAFGVEASAMEYKVVAKEISIGSLNYFTGLLNYAYPSSIAPSAKATVLGTVPFPISLDPADEFTVDVDGGGAATAVFDAAAATLPGAAGTFAAMASETMEVRFAVGGVFGDWQTITFGTEATQQLAVDLINAQMVGGYAVINGANVDIISDGKGTGATVQTQNVAAGITTKLGIPDAGDEDGTGDVSNIEAVTFAEVKTVVEADVADVVCVLDETGGLRINNTSAEVGADSTLECGGDERTKFGLDATVHTGADDDATEGVLASYESTTSFAAGAKGSIRLACRGDKTFIRAAMNGASGKVSITF